MVSITETEINLFGKELPSIDELKKLSEIVNSSEINKIKFEEQLSASRVSPLAAGIALYILGKNAQAVQNLRRAEDCKEKFLYLAYALRQLGNFDEALTWLDKASSKEADSLDVSLEKAATLRQACRFEEAARELENCANFERVSAEYHYQIAKLQQARGLYKEAVSNYKTAVELDPAHFRAVFQLAFASDLRGDEEAAIDYYKQITSTSPVYVSALLNLAVIYEDMCEYDKASECVNRVLQFHPNHQRALLFSKDIESSKTMLYDEEGEKKKSLQDKIFETPITDFELSVRSRNCLHKMNIKTIGDLLRTTEAELLAYKNFGETSLTEIKTMLESKGLQLGMAIEEKLPDSAQADSDILLAEEDLLSKSVDHLELSVRARKCLRDLNLKTLKDLVNTTEAELLGCKNFGVTSLNEIKQRLSAYGLSLRKLG